MQLTKYKLGDLIVQRREKNKDYDLPIRGVSREGFIMPKVEEADTSIYNVFYKNDFVFNPARMELNSIALNLDLDKALCSSLYEVFYVKDENLVLPEFLNLHIKRDEFARHCDYIGLGSAREYCRFANIAEFDIKIPPIEVQREIVQADRQIKRRIRLNEQMIEKLEATAQALYRKMFVDGIDKENLPEGWRMGTIGEFCEINTDNYTSKYNHSVIRYLDSSSVTENDFDDYQFLKVGEDEIPSRAKRKVRLNDIVYSTVRPNLRHYGLIKGEIDNVVVSTAFAVIRSNNSDISNELLYMWLIDDSNTEVLQGIAEMSKATYPSITNDNIQDLKIAVPQKMEGLFCELNIQLGVIFDSVYLYHREIKKLSELQSLLLAKMGNLKQ